MNNRKFNILKFQNFLNAISVSLKLQTKSVTHVAVGTMLSQHYDIPPAPCGFSAPPLFLSSYWSIIIVVSWLTPNIEEEELA